MSATNQRGSVCSVCGGVLALSGVAGVLLCLKCRRQTPEEGVMPIPKPGPFKKKPEDERRVRTGVRLAVTPEERRLAQEYKIQHGEWPPVLLTPDGDFRIVLHETQIMKIELEPIVPPDSPS